MTDYSNNKNKYIANHIGLNMKTLNSCSIGEHKKYSDLYSLTGHEYKYTTFSIILNILAIPLVVVSGVVKILSGDIVAIKHLGNIPLMILQKMDQGISKKILQGLHYMSEEKLCEITSNILHNWQDNVEIIPQQEQSYFSSFKNYICNHVPFIASIRNFWVNYGIHYNLEQLEEQKLVKQITKEIFKTSYITGKEARVLSSNDIYNHFKEIEAYKDNIFQKERDLVHHHWFYNNYDAWDVSYLSNYDSTKLIGDDNE